MEEKIAKAEALRAEVLAIASAPLQEPNSVLIAHRDLSRRFGVSVVPMAVAVQAQLPDYCSSAARSGTAEIVKSGNSIGKYHPVRRQRTVQGGEQWQGS